MELLVEVVVLFLTLRNHHTISHSNCTNFHYSKCAGVRSNFYRALPVLVCVFSFVLVFVLMVAILMDVEWYLLICISLMMIYAERLYMCLSSHLYILGEMAIQVLCPFFDQII